VERAVEEREPGADHARPDGVVENVPRRLLGIGALAEEDNLTFGEEDRLTFELARDVLAGLLIGNELERAVLAPA
jgi:hypothetical protein